jgi:hypothetical protein
MSFLLLGIDSFIACVAIGAIVSSRWRVPLAVLFGVADVVGFLVGAGLGWRIAEGLSVELQTGVLLALGLYLLVVAAGTHRIAATWPVWIVPWALTLDNLAFGLAGDRTTGALFQQAGEQALSSALLALGGLLVGVALARVLPAMERATASRFAGGALLFATGGLVLLG